MAMGRGGQQPAHVLPHDVEHGGSEEAVLDVEGVQVEVALLEDLADGRVAGADFSDWAARTLHCGEGDAELHCPPTFLEAPT